MKTLVYSLPFIAIFFFTMISQSFSQDLRITTITNQPPSTVNTGQDFDIEGRMINNTTTNAGPFYIGYWLSTNASLSSDDRFLSKKYQSGGLPGDQYTRDFEFNGLSIPSDVITGDYYIILKIDNDNQVAESNEGNNTRATIKIRVNGVTPPQPIDLVIENFDFFNYTRNSSSRTSIRNGDSGVLDFYITNLASGTYGGSFTVEVVLSEDQIFYNGNDSKVTTKTFSNGIGPNGSSTGTRFSGNISIFLAAPNNNFGTHYILIKADYSNNIDETNENNNILAVQITINDPLGGRFANPIANVKKGQNKDQEIEESLENIIADQDIAVYPNPFVEKLTLNIHDDSPSEVSILDVSGKLIWKKEYNSDTNEAIDLSSQPAGIYILKVANQGGIEVKRIVKDK